MTRSRTWVHLAAALGVVVALAAAPVGGAQRAPEATSTKAQAPGTELIVKFKPGVAAAERERVLAAAGGVIERKLRNHPARLAKVDAARLTYALKKLRSDPHIEYAEPNQRVHALVVPADPSFSQLWGLRNTGQSVNGMSGTADADIDADEAWDVTTGSSSVVVGVVDTGVDFSHPDLGGSATASPLMWKNPGETGSGKEENGIDDDGNGFVDDWRGWDFANNDNDPFDDESHGTHVTGTIGARANDGVGVSGVNWNVKIMALKFLDGFGFGSTADAVEAIAYATAKGAHVTNNSWGGGGYSQALLEAIQGADAAGSLFVAAAGNDSANNDSIPQYPSNYDVPNVVAVAASTQTDARASFSNFGRQSVHLAAPGANIYSTVPGGGYDWWDGTSMATPHVAGAAALVKAAFPSSSAVGAKALLLGSVDPKSAFANVTSSGGRLNVARAVSCSSAPMLWVEAPKAAFRVSIGDSLPIIATSTMCAGAAGATATAEVNGTPVVLTNRGDGLYTGSYAPNSVGSLTVTVTTTAGALTTTRTITGTAVDDYHFLDDTYAWIDATAGGTRLTFPSPADDESSPVALPFSFSYHRQGFTSLKVSTNGYLVFGDSPATSPFNAPIPTSDAPNGVVAPFWDDLHPGRPNAAVWQRTVGEAPNRKFVVSWINVPHFSGGNNRITFQAILEEATGDIVFQYADTSFGDEFLDHGGEATVGVENLNGTLGREFSYDKGLLQPYQATKALRVTMRDTAPPETRIDSGPSGTTTSTEATFTFSSSQTGSTFQCKLDSGAWSGCSSGVRYTDLSDATHTFQVRATDPAGNVDPSPAARTWTVDTPLETSEAPQGSWVGSYGADGYALGAWNGASDLVSLPTASLVVEQGSRYRWTETTTQVRAPQSPDGSYRRAATFFHPSELRLRLDFASAYTGTLHLYGLDWDSALRRQRVSVDDGSGARSVDLASSFNPGLWVHAPISVAAGGTVTIRVTRLAGSNAVLSGLFLGGPPTSVPLDTSEAPQGSWVASYGADGHVLAAWNGASDLVSLPNASLVVEQGGRYRWTETTTQVRAPQSPDGSYRRAATFFHPSELRLRLDFASAYSGTLHLYGLDWDSALRRQRVSVDDGSGARSVDLASSFNPGLWVHAPISVAAGGTVTIRVTRLAGSNAVLSGLFLGGAPTSVPLDTSEAPQGSWVASYGADGHALAAWNGASDLVSLPNASLVVEQGSRYRWTETTTQARAPQSPDGSYRRAATFFHPSELRLRLDFASAYSGTLHLYGLDWDSALRRQRVSVDDGSGARSVDLASSFNPGLWVHAPIAVAAGGSVMIRVTRTGGANAVLAGLFLGGGTS